MVWIDEKQQSQPESPSLEKTTSNGLAFQFGLKLLIGFLLLEAIAPLYNDYFISLNSLCMRKLIVHRSMKKSNYPVDWIFIARELILPHHTNVKHTKSFKISSIVSTLYMSSNTETSVPVCICCRTRANAHNRSKEQKAVKS